MKYRKQVRNFNRQKARYAFTKKYRVSNITGKICRRDTVEENTEDVQSESTQGIPIDSLPILQPKIENTYPTDENKSLDDYILIETC